MVQCRKRAAAEDNGGIGGAYPGGIGAPVPEANKPVQTGVKLFLDGPGKTTNPTSMLGGRGKWA